MGCRVAGLGTIVSLLLSAGFAQAADPPVTAAAPIIIPGTSHTEGEPPPDDPSNRQFAFKANYGFGFFWPSDVNDFLKARLPDNTNSTLRGLSGMFLLTSADVSAAYFPKPFFGIRPSLLYLFSYTTSRPKGGSLEFLVLHSLAPGLSLDFVLETHKLARFFASPGVSYQFGWFDGFAARGLGLELALGTELSFGRRRNKGASIALVLRYADLDVHSKPQTAPEEPTIDSLNFSSVMVRLGFQYGS